MKTRTKKNLTRRRVFRRRTTRKRVYKKKNKLTTNIRTPISRTLKTLPEMMFLKLRYADCTNVTVTAGVFSTMPYFKSSLYAPRSSGGHQPLYYDQWCYMYTKYRVYGVGYTAIMTNKSTNEAVWFGVRHQEDTSGEISIQTLLERNDSNVKMVGGYNSGYARTVIRGYMDVAKTLGVPRSSVHSDDQFQAAYNNDPARMAILYPYLLSNAVSGSYTFEFTFILTYYCVMFNQAQVQAS